MNLRKILVKRKIYAIRQKIGFVFALIFLILKIPTELNATIGIFLSIVLVFLGIIMLLLPIIVKLLGEDILFEDNHKNEIPLEVENLIDQIGNNEQTRAEKQKLILAKKIENAANDVQKVKVKLKKKYNMASSKGHLPF